MQETVSAKPRPNGFVRWLLQGQQQETEGPHATEEAHHHTHPWWKVMCLTGVDYFSTLGYQPGIAALAAGALSPIATAILVLLTLFGALPIYRRVATESPHGEGSISMLEHLLSRWKGKFFVLCLLGFVATDFIITITLSAADATAHVIENPFMPESLEHYKVLITLALIGMLSAVFLKGFKEAITIAVALVGSYLALNAVVLTVGVYEVFTHPTMLDGWQQRLFERESNPIMMVAIALLLFPKLALGLSGFETGVAVMPLVKGGDKDTHSNPVGRIANTRKLLAAAALIMSVFLLTSSLVTTLVIPPDEFVKGGEANGRALAYLAHHYLGDAFGTIYDISTISILWFAGASAMAGLLNIVPRYLPRYGMAPGWARASRPLVIVFSIIAFVVTILFNADVDAQGGAYATGVLVLMSSAALAVTISAFRRNARRAGFGFGAITLLFVYTTVVNIIERPEGIKIASFFILAIIVVSLLSRVWRSTELRTPRIELDVKAQEFINAMTRDKVRLIANDLDAGDFDEYFLKEKEIREDNLIPSYEQVVFLEVLVSDASNFEYEIKVKGVEVGPYRILRMESAAVPNSIAAFLLWLRDTTNKIPHIYFAWTEGNPFKYLFQFIVLGEGDIAPVTREILRQAEHDPERRPAVHVSG